MERSRETPKARRNRIGKAALDRLFANPAITDDAEITAQVADRIHRSCMWGETEAEQWSRRRQIFGEQFEVEYQLED